MPRPKNNDLKKRIQKTAWGQFRERGYKGTTYASIAQECGVSRNLVQYHLPSKELLVVAFMQRLLERCEEAVAENLPDAGDFEQKCRYTFEVGCCFYSVLMEHGYRTFLLEVLADRELSSEILSTDEAWTFERFGVHGKSKRDKAKVSRSVIIHTGGFFELMYRSLRSGEPFDIPDNLAYAMQPIVEGLGADHEAAKTMFDSCTLGMRLAKTINLED